MEAHEENVMHRRKEDVFRGRGGNYPTPRIRPPVSYVQANADSRTIRDGFFALRYGANSSVGPQKPIFLRDQIDTGRLGWWPIITVRPSRTGPAMR
jgi:hypothetical protein